MDTVISHPRPLGQFIALRELQFTYSVISHPTCLLIIHSAKKTTYVLCNLSHPHVFEQFIALGELYLYSVISHSYSFPRRIYYVFRDLSLSLDNSVRLKN